MQFIEGEDLAALYRRTGRQTEGDVARWGVAVLRALVYLHDHAPPIVHRDIKPANIKLTPRGEIVLLDFGLAKGRLDHHETRVDLDEPSIYGFTPGYAPPEQLAGSGTDPRSDLYALGATLYHLAVGAPPPTANERMAAVANGRPDVLTSTTSLAPRLAAVTGRALALDPAARFQSAREMLDALAGDAAPQPIDVRRAATQARRLDAAAASQAEVGREIDLLVQVRFSDSPRLGLEDWPTRRRPSQIEQVSDAVPVDHPVDAATGRRLPARLRIKLVAPDFDVRGASEQLIDVPPDEYSRRLAFLLAPRRLGYCRVNIEVYAAADAVFLGSVAVEAEALAALTGDSDRRVAELALGVAAIPPAIHEIAADGPSDRTTPMDHRGPLNVPTLSEPSGARANAGHPIPQRSRRIAQWMYGAGSAAVVLVAVMVWQSTGSMPTNAPENAAATPIPDAATTSPAASAPGPPPPGTVMSGAPSPQPPSGATTALPPAPPPAMATAPPPANPPSPGPLSPPIVSVTSSSHRDVFLQLVTIGRLPGGPLRTLLRLVNRSSSDVTINIDVRESSLSAAGAEYAVVGTTPVDAKGAPGSTVSRGATHDFWLEFAVPESVVGPIVIRVASAPGAPRFPDLRVSFPLR